jgi:glutaminase
MDYQKTFATLERELRTLDNEGEVAGYIPELRRVDPAKFGLHLTTVDLQDHSLGDAHEKFSIQSIAKVLALALAVELEDDQLWHRVGVEPSGTAFNSLVQLEYEKGIPRNPFINAGALLICDILASHLDDPQQRLLDFARKAAGSPDIAFNPRMARSEKETGFTNAALINLMKSFGNIRNDIDGVLDLYFTLCSLEMTCRELARTFLFLACDGVDPKNGERYVTVTRSKRINAIMQLCGFYDEAGEFAFKVGLPGKSGVGGGIIAVHPGHYAVAVWSPRLNPRGNSHRGMKMLELLTTCTRSSIF